MPKVLHTEECILTTRVLPFLRLDLAVVAAVLLDTTKLLVTNTSTLMQELLVALVEEAVVLLSVVWITFLLVKFEQAREALVVVVQALTAARFLP